MYKTNLLFLFCALIFASGCNINDDRSNCPPDVDRTGTTNTRLHFAYTLNKDNTDKVAERVKDMNVYVFDQKTGVLVRIISATADDIARGYFDTYLDDGQYTMVAWGGGGEDMFQGGFKDGQASGSDPDAYGPVEIGTTTLSDFRMMLATNPPAVTGDDHTPQKAQFDDLFYAMAQNVNIKSGTVQNVEFDVIKNSTLLNIHIDGLQNVPAGSKPLHVFAVGRNGVILYDNNIDSNAQNIRYEPYSQSSTDETMDAMIKTLRLDMSKENTQPVMLFIQDPVSGLNLVPPMNVITMIRNVKDANGNQVYKTQQDIDREEEFHIEIELSQGKVGLDIKVTVNGFQPVDLVPKR